MIYSPLTSELYDIEMAQVLQGELQSKPQAQEPQEPQAQEPQAQEPQAQEPQEPQAQEPQEPQAQQIEPQVAQEVEQQNNQLCCFIFPGELVEICILRHILIYIICIGTGLALIAAPLYLIGLGIYSIYYDIEHCNNYIWVLILLEFIITPIVIIVACLCCTRNKRIKFYMFILISVLYVSAFELYFNNKCDDNKKRIKLYICLSSIVGSCISLTIYSTIANEYGRPN